MIAGAIEHARAICVEDAAHAGSGLNLADLIRWAAGIAGAWDAFAGVKITDQRITLAMGGARPGFDGVLIRIVSAIVDIVAVVWIGVRFVAVIWLIAPLIGVVSYVRIGGGIRGLVGVFIVGTQIGIPIITPRFDLATGTGEPEKSEEEDRRDQEIESNKRGWGGFHGIIRQEFSMKIDEKYRRSTYLSISDYLMLQALSFMIWIGARSLLNLRFCRSSALIHHLWEGRRRLWQSVFASFRQEVGIERGQRPPGDSFSYDSGLD